MICIHPYWWLMLATSGRVAMQARKQGIRAVVPAELPRQFVRDPVQPWVGSLGLWVPREVFGSLVLRAQGKL